MDRYRAGLIRDLFTAMLNARFDEISHRADPPFLGAGAGSFDFTRGTSLFFVQAQVKDGSRPQPVPTKLWCLTAA